MKTWEVKLLAGNNGVIQTNVEADWWRATSDGVTFVKTESEGEVDVAYYPTGPLLGVKDVTP
jgi:hypothetical protein